MKENQQESKRILPGFLGDVAVFSVAQAIAGASYFVYMIVCARLLGPTQFGLFQAIMGFFGILILFGSPLNIAALHGVADSDDDTKPYVLGQFLRIAFIIGIICALSVLLFSRHLATILHSQTITPFFCVAFLLIVGPVLTSFYGGLQGQNKYTYFSTAKIIESLAVIAAGSALLTIGAGVTGAVFGYAAGMGGVVAFLLTRRSFYRYKKGKYSIRKNFRSYGKPLAVLGALLFVCNYPVIIARIRLSGEESGLYGVLFSLRNTVIPFALAVALPFYTRSVSGNTVPMMFRKAIILTACLGCGFLFVSFSAPGLFLRLFYGASYEAAADFMALYGCYLFIHMICMVLMLRETALNTLRPQLLLIPVITVISMVIIQPLSIDIIIIIQMISWGVYLACMCVCNLLMPHSGQHGAR